MLRLRLKKIGRKRFPSYRLAIMESLTRRDGRSIDEIGYYNPATKEFFLDTKKAQKWLSYGVKPTPTVSFLLRKAGFSEADDTRHQLLKRN